MKKRVICLSLIFVFFAFSTLLVMQSNRVESVYAVEQTVRKENDVAEFLKFEQAILELNNTNGEKDLDNEICAVSSKSNDDYDIRNDGEFALKRLIVQGKIQNTYGAINKISYNNLHILCYSSEQATELAYQQLSKNSSLDIIIDKIEKTQGYAEQDYSYTSYNSWGAEAADIGGYRQFLLDNNVDKEIVVVVMDTGINTSHPMFEDRLLTDGNGKIKGFSYVDSTYRYSYDNLAFDEDDPNTNDIDETDTNKYSFEDDDGHGTSVAGIICDLTPSNVKILPIKIAGTDGKASIYTMIAAYLRVVNIYSKQYNIVCTNLSFTGGGKESVSAKDIYNEQCYEPLMDLNILSVTGAGNDKRENDLYGLKAVVVSALKKEGNEYLFDDSYSDYGEIIDISAPASNVLTPAIAKTDSDCSETCNFSGTSSASPHVAGIVALLYLNPNLPSDYTAEDIEQSLYDNSLDFGVWGHDKYYGHGMINLRYFEVEKTDETLSFYEDNNIVNEYEEYKNFEQDFELSIQCSNPNYDIIYTTNKEIVKPTNSINYSSALEVSNTIYIYAMGVKIEGGEIVKKTKLYNISYFDALTPIEDCFDISGSILTNYTGHYNNLTIPKFFDGKKINHLDTDLFENSKIEKITLPDTINSLFGSVFKGCISLKYIYAPNVTEIVSKIFFDCDSLTFITDKHPTKNEEMGAFFPNLIKIDERCFEGCSNLETVNLPKVETLGNYVFSDCSNLETVSLPNVRILGSYAFSYCSNLKNVYLPLITSFPIGAFAYCENLTGTFKINKYIDEIGYAAFAGTKINKFIVDENNKNFVTDGYGVYSTNTLVAFACGNENINYEILSFVTINNKEYTIDTIEQEALYGGKFNNLIIPESIININKLAFFDSEINHLYYNATNCSHSGYYNENTGYLYKPFGRIKTIEIGANVQVVPQRLFSGIYFNNVIINSINTLFSEACFYIQEKGLNKIIFNFTEEIDEDYLNNFDLTYMYNYGINYIYAKTEIPERLTNGYYFRLRYSIHDGEFYVYSNKSLEDKFMLKASTNQYGQISQDRVLYVSEGTSQTYTFTPNLGYHVSNILVDSVNLTGNELINAIESGYTFSEITSNHTIEAVFAANTYSITYKDEAGSIMNGLYPTSYNYGTSVMLPADIEKQGYVFAGWYDNESFEGDAVTTISPIDFGNKVYYAKFNKIYEMTIVQSENGTITSDGNTEIVYGDNVKITFTPNDGYHVDKIVVDGVELSGDELNNAIKNGYLFTNINSNHTISATYAINTYIFTTITDQNGTINTTGGSKVEYGQDKTFTFVPNKGYKINEVYIDGINMGSITTYTFEDVTEEHEIYVTFTKVRYPITVTVIGEGTASSNANVIYGASVTFYFTAKEGHKIKDVLVDGESVGAVNSYMFTNVDKSHNILVEFEILKFNITLSIDGAGKVKCEESLNNVSYGEDRIIYIEAQEGWEIDKVYINGEIVNIVNNQFKVYEITKDFNIKVVFIEKPKVDIIVILIISGIATSGLLIGTILIIKSKKRKAKRNSKFMKNIGFD